VPLRRLSNLCVFTKGDVLDTNKIVHVKTGGSSHEGYGGRFQ